MIREMKLPLLVTCLAALSACAAQPTGDIRWKPELLNAGDYVSVSQSRDGLIHHMFVGSDRGNYVVQSYRGASPEGEPAFTTVLDRDGNYLLWEDQDGYQVRYEPHDCTRTLGTCRYTEIRPNNLRVRWTRVTTATEVGFKYVETDRNGGRKVTGEIALDARGVAGDGTVNGYFGGQNFTVVNRSYE